jgi:hypothetical protein
MHIVHNGQQQMLINSYEISICIDRPAWLLYLGFKGSRKNKFTFLGVEAPAWQGAEALEYRDISALGQRRQAGCIGA